MSGVPTWLTSVPTPVRRVILERAGRCCERCSAPGREGDETWCGLHIHHRQRPKDGGEHSAENMLLLCRTCHDAADEEDHGERGGRPASGLAYPHKLFSYGSDEDRRLAEELAARRESSIAALIRDLIREEAKRKRIGGANPEQT